MTTLQTAVGTATQKVALLKQKQDEANAAMARGDARGIGTVVSTHLLKTVSAFSEYVNDCPDIGIENFDSAFYCANLNSFVQTILNVIGSDSLILENPTKHKFLLTGGFSNLYCVTYYLKKILNNTLSINKGTGDIVFAGKKLEITALKDLGAEDNASDSLFISTNKAQKIEAVACGAAWLAAKNISENRSVDIDDQSVTALSNAYTEISLKAWDKTDKYIPLLINGRIEDPQQFFIVKAGEAMITLRLGTTAKPNTREVNIPIPDSCVDNGYIMLSVEKSGSDFNLIVKRDSIQKNYPIVA